MNLPDKTYYLADSLMMKRIIFAVAVTGVILAGCDSNPTNEPSQEAINKAVDNKYAAIDNDKTLTQAQKDEMKKHMTGKTRSRDGYSSN